MAHSRHVSIMQYVLIEYALALLVKEKCFLCEHSYLFIIFSSNRVQQWAWLLLLGFG